MDLEDTIKTLARQAIGESIMNLSDRVATVELKLENPQTPPNIEIDLEALDQKVSDSVTHFLNLNQPHLQDRIIVEHRHKPELEKIELEENCHPKLREAIDVLSTGIPVALIGPTGSGKTLAAKQIAKALQSKNFCAKQMCRSVQLHDFLGYTTSSGSYVEGYLVPVIRDGGLGFIDECDNGNENTLMVLKGIFSRHIHIPFHGMTVPSEETKILVAMNTWGNGATREYVGRNSLDAAFMNEFYCINWDYDQKFEESLVKSSMELTRWNAVGRELLYGMWDLRENVEREKLKVIVSTRSIMNTIRLFLRPKADLGKILKGLVFRNLIEADVERVMPATLEKIIRNSSSTPQGPVTIPSAKQLFDPSFQATTQMGEAKKYRKDAPF